MRGTNINTYFENTGIGSSTNRTKIDSSGHMTMEGTATVHEDVSVPLIGATLESVAGKVDYDYTNNAIVFQPGGVITTVNDLLRSLCRFLMQRLKTVT